MAEMISPVSEDSEPLPNTCPVCLSPFTGQQVATLENCQHTFCLECILEWSKIANSCPVDRISFDVIYQRLHLGGLIQNEIRVQRRVPADDEGDDDRARAAVNCEACGRSDRRHLMLVCSCCESGYHMNCLTRQVELIPGEIWSCPECAALSPPRSEEERVSDGELSELLVDAEGDLSTRSRLRPSTLSQPGRSTAGVRRSQRIQNASGADADTAWPTCLHVPKYLIRATESAETGDGETSAQPKNGQKECMSNGTQQLTLYCSSTLNEPEGGSITP